MSFSTKLSPYFNKISVWWGDQLSQSQSIQLVLQKYRNLQQRQKLWVKAGFILVLLLFIVKLVAPIFGAFGSINTNYQQAIADKNLAIKGITVLQRTTQQGYQIIDASKLNSFLQQAMRAKSVLGKIEEQGKGTVKITWSNIDYLPQVFIFMDYLTDTGLIVRGLQAGDNGIVATIQTQ